MRWIDAEAPVVIACVTDTGAAPKTAVSADRARSRRSAGREASGSSMLPSGADLLGELDDGGADGVPVALGLEVAFLPGAMLVGPDHEAGRQAAFLRRGEIAVVGGAQHHLVRLEVHAVDHAEIGLGIGLIVLEGLAREAMVP